MVILHECSLVRRDYLTTWVLLANFTYCTVDFLMWATASKESRDGMTLYI